MGINPMPVRDGDAKHAAAKPVHRADTPAAPLIAAAERCFHLADQVDYSIRRLVIPAHDEVDRPAAARLRSSVAPSASRAAPRANVGWRREGALSEMQAAIARALGAEYDLAEPLPDRLADLLRQLQQRSGDGGYRKMAVGRT
jgi:hypothetical protein